MKLEIRRIINLLVLMTCSILVLANVAFTQTGEIAAANSEPIPETATLVSCKVGTSWYQKELLISGPSANSAQEAQKVIEKILPTIGYLPGTIIAKEAKVSNAEICRSTENKYILYNPQWFSVLYKDSQEEWADIGIFAHEIAHFQLNHDSKALGSSPEIELEADELAGEIMAKLKLTLEQSLTAFKSEKMKNSGSHTHPDTEKRLAAVEKGWKKICGNAVECKVEITILFEKCLDFGNSKKFDEAIDCYTKVITLDPKNIASYLNRAFAFGGKGNHREAIKNLTEAIKLNETANIKNPIIYNSRGLAYGLINETDNAIADFNKAIEIDPRFAVAFHNRGYAYTLKTEIVKGIADYSRAIGLSPQNSMYYFSRGIAYGNRGETSRAISDFTEVIKLDPQNPFAYANRGFGYASLSEFERAIADFTESIKINSQNAGFYKERAKAYRSLGRNNLAEADEQTAVSIGN